MKRRLLVLVPLLLAAIAVAAQTAWPWEEYLSRMSQLEDTESAGWEQTYEELAELASRKLDLNRCSREDLQRLPFLSDRQIMDIMEYRDRARRIETAIELRLIPSLERRDVDMLMQFVEIGPEQPRDSVPPLRLMARYARHELVGTVKVPFYSRRGDREGYLGYAYKHWLRYTLTATRHVKAGVVASQDAGEPFFAGRNAAGYDFYSAYLMLRDMGRLRTLALGRYRLRTGMGLILNNSMGMGKLNTLSMMGRTANQVYAHSSRSEANYLQGAAATVDIGRGWEATAFVSWRKIDATLNRDSATVATLLTSGYHRTTSEMARRRNTSQLLTGANLRYAGRGLHLGLTTLYASFNRELRPDRSAVYRRWQPAGTQFWNASIDYGYLAARLAMSGETAVDTRGAIATVNTLSYRLLSNLSLMALQRYYPYQFCAVYGESFADGGAVNNESGLYVGASWAPARGLGLTAYADVAYFAWPRYRVSASSYSQDCFVQATLDRGPWQLLARYRLKRRQLDNAEKTALRYRTAHRARVSAGFDGGRWTLRSQADLTHSTFAARSIGYMVSEYVACHWGGLRLQGTVGYFNTDDYSSRVYVYEPGTLYQFSFANFSGEGMRCAVVARAALGSHATLMAKVGVTRYFDRDTIGSGLQEVRGSCLTDMELQLRLKL